MVHRCTWEKRNMCNTNENVTRTCAQKKNKKNNENTQINKQTNNENNKKKNICINESTKSDQKSKTSQERNTTLTSQY